MAKDEKSEKYQVLRVILYANYAYKCRTLTFLITMNCAWSYRLKLKSTQEFTCHTEPLEYVTNLSNVENVNNELGVKNRKEYWIFIKLR